jgi:hypothetical protein
MSSSEATRRASSTAFSEQHPALRLFCSSSPRGHCCNVMPTTSCPCACRSAAATEESTPPDIATAIFTSGSPRCVEHDLRVLSDPIQDGGLHLSHPVHTYKVKPRHRRSPIDLHRKPHFIEDGELHPVVLGPIAAGPDDGVDALAHHIDIHARLDPHRGRNLVSGPCRPGRCAVPVDVAPYVRPACVAKVDAGG